MRVADWLTYTSIEHLHRLRKYYGSSVKADSHSKHELIRSILFQMNDHRCQAQMLASCSKEDRAFLELIVLDTTPSYTMEELLGKGRIALCGEKGKSPRQIVVQAVTKGWLFPGHSAKTQGFYYVPIDLRQQMLRLLAEPFIEEPLLRPPAIYRNEEDQLVNDLRSFLQFIGREIVQLTNEGAIYRQQQKQLFQTFVVQEEPLHRRGPRFGFGRSYHLYPDRLALLYDYALYQGYFVEEQIGTLRLTEYGLGKVENRESFNGEELYQFWLRLYRHPIPQLPMIVRWVAILIETGWIESAILYQAVESWISPYYYETKESLFQKILQMMLHLGVIRLGVEQEKQYVSCTSSGKHWMKQGSFSQLKEIEKEFTRTQGKFV